MVKMYKFKFFKTSMGFLLMVVLNSNHLTAQKAENLFSNHFKWGVTGQFNTFKAAEITENPNNPNVKYAILKDQKMAVGLSYNFYQYKNWNLSVSLQLQWFGNEEELYIAQEETSLPSDFYRWSRIENDHLIYLPVTVEYVFLETDSFYFALGGGLGLTYYKYFEQLTDGGLSIDGVQVFSFLYNSSENPFYGSTHLESSIYFKSKSFILQASVIYNKSFKPYRIGGYKFMNLQVSPDVTGTIDQSGDYLGLSLTFYLKKIDFRKNK